MLPEGNTLPNLNYETKKKLVRWVWYTKKYIHVLPNDCILYRNEYEDLRRCPRCGLSRYKVKVGKNDENVKFAKEGPPTMVVWYLSVIARLKRLFANTNDSKNLWWHADNRKCDGLLCHPADSLWWKNIYKEFPEFGKEPRNLRLGLTTDGMIPFENLSSNHSS